jgi:hypothetical protein
VAVAPVAAIATLSQSPVARTRLNTRRSYLTTLVILVRVEGRALRPAYLFCKGSNILYYLGRLQASPLTAFLKVPLPWYQSSTVAFRPDETHQSIRKTFSSPDRDNLRNQFCGYCGTQLSQLDDSSREEDDFISLTIGSLLDEDLEKLGELGLLDDLEDNKEGLSASQEQQRAAVTTSTRVGVVNHRGVPWFEDLIEDSQLGRLRRQKGGHTSADGSMTVQWEVMEWTSADQEDDGVSGKRKRGDPDPELDTTL